VFNVAGQISKRAGYGPCFGKSQSSEKTVSDTYHCRGKLRTGDGGEDSSVFQNFQLLGGSGRKSKKS